MSTVSWPETEQSVAVSDRASLLSLAVVEPPCPRIMCPWCVLHVPHEKHDVAKAIYDDHVQRIRQKGEAAAKHDLILLNLIMQCCEAELRAADRTFTPVAMVTPVELWPWIQYGQVPAAAAAASSNDPGRGGVWGPEFAANIGTPSLSPSPDRAAGGGKSKKKKYNPQEEWGWLLTAADDAWFAFLTSTKVLVPDRELCYEVEVWMSNTKGWQPVGTQNQNTLMEVLMSPERYSRRVELVDDQNVRRTYHVYWHEQYQGLQYNIVSGTWRFLRANPRPRPRT